MLKIQTPWNFEPSKKKEKKEKNIGLLERFFLYLCAYYSYKLIIIIIIIKMIIKRNTIKLDTIVFLSFPCSYKLRIK